MAYELKEGQGSLWRNKDKKTEKHPDHTGSVMIDGRVYRLSAWVNETKDGKKYFSLKASPADEKPLTQQREQPRSRDMNDDVPF